ncbi:hypothetical protein IL306_008118 [Fusarium sp. DS 682]|nr:hypothetical protein IL306_008118 [Fusarium sp. DS 682]
MSSLPERFVIIVDGQHVTKPDHDRNEVRPAEVGDKSSTAPAIFELQGDVLVSGDWAMGRSKFESQVTSHFAGTRKPDCAILWFRKDQAEQLYPVLVKERDNGPQIRFICNTMDEEGRPLAVSNDKHLICYASDDYDPGMTVEIVASKE